MPNAVVTLVGNGAETYGITGCRLAQICTNMWVLAAATRKRLLSSSSLSSSSSTSSPPPFPVPSRQTRGTNTSTRMARPVLPHHHRSPAFDTGDRAGQVCERPVRLVPVSYVDVGRRSPIAARTPFLPDVVNEDSLPSLTRGIEPSILGLDFAGDGPSASVISLSGSSVFFFSIVDRLRSPLRPSFYYGASTPDSGWTIQSPARIARHFLGPHLSRSF